MRKDRLHSIRYGYDADAWRLYAVRDTDKAFEEIKNKVLERDADTCQYCGFQANKYMHVVNIDIDYRNNILTNMATACPFCAQCQFLPMVGKFASGGGSMIFCPEMTQEKLNGLCHVLFCAISNGSDYMAEAQEIYSHLRLRSQVIEEQLGKGLSKPQMLGQMIVDAPIKNQESIARTLFPQLRVLPSRKRFSKEIKEWAMMAANK